MSCRSLGQTSLESVKIVSISLFECFPRRPLHNLVVIPFRYTGGRSSEQLYEIDICSKLDSMEAAAVMCPVCQRSYIERQIIQWKFNGVKIEREKNNWIIVFVFFFSHSLRQLSKRCQNVLVADEIALCTVTAKWFIHRRRRRNRPPLEKVLANVENNFNFTVHNSIKSNKRRRPTENEKAKRNRSENIVAIPHSHYRQSVRSIKWVNRMFCGDEERFPRRW